MLHTKYRGNRSTVSGEGFEGFLPYNYGRGDCVGHVSQMP